MTSRNRLLILLITAPVLAFAVVGGFLGKVLAREGNTIQHLRVFEDVVSLILSNYVEEVKLDAVMRGAMHGLADGLDPDSAYLTADQVRAMERADQPGPADTGLELTRQYYLRVIAARDDSPAARAGLQAGDVVRAINDQSTRDLSVFDGAHLLRGSPGSKVTLTIIRGNAAEPHRVELTRERITAPDVSSRLISGRVGYVRVAAFGKRSAEAIKTQVEGLTQRGVASLIIDVRSTAGGDVDSGLAAARLFVPSGVLAVRASRGGLRETVSAASGDGALSVPVVLLIDTGTSGPAELFSAALAGNRRAELIGEKTLGRAAIQTLVKLPDGSGLWLSTAWYLRPDGTAVHEKGLDPTIAVEQPEVDFGAPPATSDPILERALEHLSSARRAA